MRKWNIVAIAAVLGIAAVTFHAYAADKLKVGFIYVGPIGDLGWSYQHDLGRKAMEKALGEKVETTFLEKVPEGPDAERSIEQLAQTLPFQDPKKLVATISGIPGYRAEFSNVFGPDSITPENIATAIGDFTRTILSGDS